MKFQKSDSIYLKKRAAISQKYGPRELWSVIDHWPLYCGISNLARFLTISDIFRSTLSIPGHVAEFGSWRGANLLFLTKLLRILDPNGNKIVHCFDSFQGLSEFTDQDGNGRKSKGDYKGSLKELKDIIKLYHLTDEIVIHKGLIEKTLPKVIAKNKSLTFSFVYCDVDLYQSTKTILELLHPRLSKGGVFVFDEWNYENFPGESVAVNEFLKTHGKYYQVEHISQTRQPSLLIRKYRY